MTYQSVDALQKALAETIFSRTSAPKKASGRALGTLVELITFYMIRSWGLELNLAIERGLPEYGNSEISHNVEFTLHDSRIVASIDLPEDVGTLTPTAITRLLPGIELGTGTITKSRTLLKGDTVRHAMNLANGKRTFFTAHLSDDDRLIVVEQKNKPYAMFECKRVGVEEGQTKGPQTIEKAKQGAYVARSVSGLQRVPRRDGTVSAIVEDANGALVTHPDYDVFLRNAIVNKDINALTNVVLTVGVVSNHGNWFTARHQNKEMKVLAQSYDWLLFLTDDALAEFIELTLLGSSPKFEATRKAFNSTYSGSSRATTFTKVTIDRRADLELTAFFAAEQPWERWFNVITPNRPISELREDLLLLAEIGENHDRR